MKVAGFVAEFNPFHNGHKYLIDQIRKDGFDFIIAAMSPNFVMRGEPAIFDKFKRTKIALSNGIDLVLEIPTIYSIQSADVYASKGIEILKLSGVTDLYFGSESNDLNALTEIASLYESDEYKKYLKEYLDCGSSFNQSSKQAILKINSKYKDILNSPNDLLGIEYIKAIKKNNYDIKIHLVKRISTGYYDEIKDDTSIQSSTALRKALMDNNYSHFSYKVDEFQKHVNIDYFELIKFKIISSTKEELSEILMVNDGFENRLKSIKRFVDYDTLVEDLMSKRDRKTKINRILMAVLLSIKKDEIKERLDYVRVLGFNSKGQNLLKEIKDNTIFITQIKRDLNDAVYREIDFTKIYSLPYNEELYKEEYSPVIMR